MGKTVARSNRAKDYGRAFVWKRRDRSLNAVTNSQGVGTLTTTKCGIRPAYSSQSCDHTRCASVLPLRRRCRFAVAVNGG
jgi:hypothetical protein